MIVVGSCGWLEYLDDGPNAGRFAEALEDPDQLIIPSVCLYEVFRKTLREIDRDAAVEVIAIMRQSRVVPLSDNLACHAAELAHELKLALADSVILATARQMEAILWTQDAHFEGLSGVKYFKK